MEYLYSKICPHCDKKLKMVKDISGEQICDHCQKKFQVVQFSQLEKIEEILDEGIESRIDILDLGGEK